MRTAFPHLALLLAGALLAAFVTASPAGAINVCGDGICQGTGVPPETRQNCPQDCGGFCGDGLCAVNENCSLCVADCRSRCLSFTLPSDLKKASCAGDDDGDCLDNASEANLAWIVAPYYYYDEDENCSGAPYTQSFNAARYGRKDFYQVRPMGSRIDLWQANAGAKTVQITYFLLHPHDCQGRPIIPDGHQGDSENIRFKLASTDLRTWTLVSGDFFHHNRVHTFSGEYLKARASEIGTSFPNVAADEDGHGSWAGEKGSSSACAGSEDDFCFGSCDCFRGTMASAFANGYREILGATRNVGGPCPERWRPGVVTVAGSTVYSSFDVGFGSIPEYWTPRTDAWKKFCGWECSLRYSDGTCAYSVDGKSGCSSPLSEKVDKTCFTTAAAPSCTCPAFAAASAPSPLAGEPEARQRLRRSLATAAVQGLPWLDRAASAEVERRVADAPDPLAALVPLLEGRNRQGQLETLRWMLAEAPEKWESALAEDLLQPGSRREERREAAGAVLRRVLEILEVP